MVYLVAKGGLIMEQLFSFEEYKKIFDDYADRYDKNDGRITLKIVHTNAVVAVMERLCSMRRLPEHTKKLALLCAQFHDIGRFEQLKQYDTFLDHKSINHAVLSCRVLEENHMLSGLSDADRKKVLTAIANHNKLEIDPTVISAAEHGTDPSDISAASYDARECLELCRLIRDADKCDIFRVFATDDMADVVGVSEEQISHETISPQVLQSIRDHRCIDKTLRKTYLDYWVSFLGFLFDLNYPESMKIIKEQGYYRMPFDRTVFTDPKTEKDVNEVLSLTEQYIESFSQAPSESLVPASLQEFFREHPTLALAFSGGTDSAYLLYAARACGCSVHAYYVASPFQPAFELEDAKQLAESLGAPMTVLPLDVLENEIVRKNPADRCYHCKNAIFSHILEAACKDGYREIIDGTNASDDAGDRPGMRALRELKILSPLRICGVTKKALREYSRNAGLFTWNKPAYACLATRVPTGVEIDASILKKVESAEQALSAMGFRDFRVRVLLQPTSADSPDKSSWIARLQITKDQLPLLIEKQTCILDALKDSFPDIVLDLRARSASS